MTENKIVPIFLFSIIASIFLMSFVSAIVMTPTLQSPDANEYIIGTYNINGNFPNNSGIEPYANVTIARFYYRIDGTGSWTLISSVTNTSAFQTAFNLSWASTGLVDDANIEFNITLANSTDTYDSDTSTGVKINNGVPTATFGTDSLGQNGAVYTGQSLTLSVSADSTIGVDNCTIYFTTNNQRVNTTASSNACSVSITNTNFSLGVYGEFDYVIGLRDGNSNETNTSSRRLTIYNTPQGSGGGGTQTIVSTSTPEVGEEGVSPGTQATPSGKPFGEAVSNFFKKIGDFFKDIFSKKS